MQHHTLSSTVGQVPPDLSDFRGLGMRNVVTLVLGGTGHPAVSVDQVPFQAGRSVAGKYRLIDIPLSNCINSGLNRATS